MSEAQIISNHMSNRNPEEIRQSIDRTKTSLFAKLESLETEVLSEVNVARGYVQQKVDDVKSAVDLRTYIKSKPLLSLSAGALLGFVVGSRLPSKSIRNDTRKLNPNAALDGIPFSAESLMNPRQGNGDAKPFLTSLTERFGPEITELKSITIGALFAPLRGLTSRNVGGELAGKINGVLDSVIEKI